MASMPAEKPPTLYEQLLAVPEHLIAEIIDGDLLTQPRPGPPHARVASTLGVDLGGPFDRGKGGPGGWVLLDEPELHLHGNVLVPDLAGWRRERMPELPKAAAFELAPDWVCEVLSPGTAVRDRKAKRPIYARERVGHLWLIDPLDQTLEVFRLRDDGWQLVNTWSGDDRVRAEPFDAVELELGALWAL